MQPTGEACLVICRISSPKYTPDNGRNLTKAVRYQEYMNLRVQEGYEIARRLARNCPRPVRFSTVWSTCFEQKSYKWTNWHEVVRPSAMVHDIRSRIQQIGEKKITIVIRAIDGLTCIEEDFGGFLTMVINEGKDAQIVFQMEKGL
ncbi:hypothetical protein ACJQWK_11852 [Exserohilum turcicum]